ncbi:S24 family peptidase [Haloimpatiens sp. FM7315]|uniref:S24 family peptidase n=1 Tax=Haloimpatiens sp. FM7315 TaxID=3298609 RepID=UPI00370CA7F0
MSRIGEKIQQIRNQKGISAKELSKKLGVAEKFVVEVELGRKVMNEVLIEKVSKILGENLNDLTLNYVEDKNEDKVEAMHKKFHPNEKNAMSEEWTDALSSILKPVPVYDYSLKKVLEKRKLPVFSNKIEGYNQDKVLFLFIEDDDMSGFRISKGDIAFGHKISEIENDSFCLIEYDGQRILRQIKRIDSSRVLLVSNKGSVLTKTAEVKSIKPLVKIEKVEIKL